MNALARRLTTAWYGEAPVPVWARLAESVYRAMTRLRRTAYQRGWLRSGHPGAPVVVVGNLTAGGAGKSPVVMWLARTLAERGHAPAIISRGYGGAEPARPHRVGPEDRPAFSGDEPLMMARHTGLPVWICRDRLAAAHAAVAAGADIIIADDGLQHYRLRRDLEVAVVDGARGLGNGRCLPAGPLREPATRLAEVDLVICNGPDRCPEGAMNMQLVGHVAVRLDGSIRRGLEDFAPGPVHAIAGIGYPERFFALLESHGLELLRHPLPDHGAVPSEWLTPADELPVLMTAKDAARCAHDPAASQAWQVPVEARFEDEGARLLQLVAHCAKLRDA